MAALLVMMQGHGDDTTKVVEMGVSLARFLLRCFKDYGGLYTPYEIGVDLTWWSTSPSRGLSTWCLAAVQLLEKHAGHVVTPEEAGKVMTILLQFITQARPSKGGGLSEVWEWLIY